MSEPDVGGGGPRVRPPQELWPNGPDKCRATGKMEMHCQYCCRYESQGHEEDCPYLEAVTLRAQLADLRGARDQLAFLLDVETSRADALAERNAELCAERDRLRAERDTLVDRAETEKAARHESQGVCHYWEQRALKAEAERDSIQDHVDLHVGRANARVEALRSELTNTRLRYQDTHARADALRAERDTVQQQVQHLGSFIDWQERTDGDIQTAQSEIAADLAALRSRGQALVQQWRDQAQAIEETSPGIAPMGTFASRQSTIRAFRACADALSAALQA